MPILRFCLRFCSGWLVVGGCGRWWVGGVGGIEVFDGKRDVPCGLRITWGF